MATSQSDDSDRRLFPVCSLCNLRTSLASLFRAGRSVFRARLSHDILHDGLKENPIT